MTFGPAATPALFLVRKLDLAREKGYTEATKQERFPERSPWMNVKNTPKTPITLFLVGDSTMAAFPPEENRHGYGTCLQDFFDDSVRVVNLALSGRSSKSFLREPEYATLLASMKSGDRLAIAFGHNDEKPDSARHTDPNVSMEDPAGFAHHLDRFYLQPALARGVKPILCTPIVRRDPEGKYVGAHVHRPAGEGGGDYPLAVRELARIRKVTLVDMTRATERLYRSRGSEGTLDWHARNSEDAGLPDNTHLSKEGARRIALLWAEELLQSGDPLSERLLFPAKQQPMDFHEPTIR